MNVIAVVLALLLGAGPIKAETNQKVDAARMQVIWNAFHDRLHVQSDVWFDDGEFPRVIQLLKVICAMMPGDYEQATNLGWMLENVERWSDALTVYVDFRKKNAQSSEAYYPEAKFYFDQKLYSKVPPLLEPTLSMPVKPHANTYRVLALAYERLGLLSNAKRIWNLLIERDPADGAAKVNLARVDRKMKGEQTDRAPEARR